MSQLKMLWYDGNEMDMAYKIPQGYTVRHIEYCEIADWIEVESSLFPQRNNDDFVKEILFGSPCLVSPKNIICSYDENGKMLSSAIACVDPIEKKGVLHMVEARPEARGKGLGKAVCSECVRIFLTCGIKSASLLTDDFRLPAIAIYLKLGFRPYYYEEGMKERWEKILSELKWKEKVEGYEKEL